MVPGYRMKPGMIVSSDRQRENFYRDLGFTQGTNQLASNVLYGKANIANISRFLRRPSHPTLRPYHNALVKLLKPAPGSRELSAIPSLTSTSLVSRIALQPANKQSLIKLIRLRRTKKLIPNVRDRQRLGRRATSYRRIRRVRRMKSVCLPSNDHLTRLRAKQQRLLTLRLLLKLKRSNKRAARRATRNASYFTRFLRLPKTKKKKLRNFVADETDTNAHLSKFKSGHGMRRTTLTSSKADSTTFTSLASGTQLRARATSGLGYYTSTHTLLLFLTNPFLLKAQLFNVSATLKPRFLEKLIGGNFGRGHEHSSHTNLVPHSSFSKVFLKQIASSLANRVYRDDVTP